MIAVSLLSDILLTIVLTINKLSSFKKKWLYKLLLLDYRSP